MRVATDDGFTEAMTTIPPNPEEALVTISTPKSDTVRVRDRVESSRFELYFDEDVVIERTSTEQAYFPVDVAAKCSWKGQSLDIPILSSIHVYDPTTGDNIAICNEISRTVHTPPDGAILEVVTAPMKIYIAIGSGSDIIRKSGTTSITNLDPDGGVVIWSRSLHEKPSGTITTPPTTDGLMRAVSRFGSALKTTSPERSWPTLRGYPPKIQVAEEFSAPPSTDRPDVDIRLEIPETLDAIFQTAPLAYYCAAEVVGANRKDAALVADNNCIPLDADRLTYSSSRLLQKFFTLDCIVRTAGFYPTSVSGTSQVLAELPWDVETMYDATLEEQLISYSDVPYEVLKDVRPQWPLTADIEPSFDTVKALPHLAEELAKVRTPKSVQMLTESPPDFISGFVRADGGPSLGARTASDSVSGAKNDITVPEQWDTQLHTFLRNGYPLGSNKTSIRAYERHLERQAPESATIEVHVVCNDEEMREEEIVTEFYGVRDLLEFNVESHYNLTVEETKLLLESEFDLLHFIGHNDEEGIKCRDGYLDARTDVTTIGIDAFILNACRSVEQAEALIKHGAHGGICTLYDVPNSSATRVGRTLSRLLNRGFNLRSALDIARGSSVLGRRWISLGDGRLALTQPESGVPLLVDIEQSGNDQFDVEIEFYETLTHRLGAVTSPNTEWGQYSIIPGTTSNTIDSTELEDFLKLEVLPVRFQDTLYWSDEVSVAELVSENEL